MSKENTRKEIDLLKLAGIVWQQRKRVIKWGVIGGLIGIIIGFSLPKKYTSFARVAPEEKQQVSASLGMLASMMGARTSTDFAAVNSMLYIDVLQSTPFVMEFANIPVTINDSVMPLHSYLLENQSYPWWNYIFALPGKLIGLMIDTEKIPFEESIRQQQIFVKNFNQAILVEQDEDTRVFDLESTFQNPVVAKMVLDTMLVKLQDYMNNYHTAKTKETIETNMAMLEEARQKYYAADNRFAEAVDKNRNLVSQSATAKLDRLANEKNLAFSIYQQIALQVESDKLKLQDQKQIATIIEPTYMPIIPSSPRKFLIMVAFGFLAGCIVVSKIVIKHINQ